MPDEPIDYKASGVDLDAYEQTMALLPAIAPADLHPPGDRVAGRLRRPVPARRQHRPVHPDLPRPGPGRLDRRRGHEAEARLRHRPTRDGRHRPGRDVGQRLPLRRGRAAAVPRLRGDEPRRPGPDRAGRPRGSATAASRPNARSWAARRRSCPTSTTPGEYDLAGFCLGVVERKQILDGKEIRPGDKVIGLASSGLHSNGYSLARKLAFEGAGLQPDSFVPELGCTVADEFLRPTRIYVRALKTVYRHYRVKRIVHGIAHITGGG